MTVPADARRALLVLLIAGAATRLAGVSHPPVVVFDEVHWGKAVNAYCCSGERIFDVHPPHGKLLLTLGAVLGGYRGGMSFDTIGLPYQPTSAWAFRLVPALAGIAIPLLFFLLLRRLGGSVPAAFLGGLLLVFDNALLLATHVMVFDGLLVAAILGALVCVLGAEAARTPGRARAWRLSGGALAGLAVGTKFTGLVAPGLIGVWWALRLFGPPVRRGRVWRDGAEMAVAATVVYLAGWLLHFALLTSPGPADAFHPTTGRLFEDLRVTHTTMIEANANMRTPHPDASGPLSWPVMKVAPFFWAGPDASIHLVGNPVVWWGSSLLLLVIIVNMGLARVTRLRVDVLPGAPVPGARAGAWLPLTGYALAFLPFFGVTRVLFLYHYLTPLVFAVAAVMLWLDRAGWIRSARIGDQRASYYAAIGLGIVAFVLISPVTYGFSAGPYDEWLMAVLRSWR